MISNTRNVITTNPSKESTSLFNSKYIHGSVYQIPPNHPYTQRNNSNSNDSQTHSLSRSHIQQNNSYTNPNTNAIYNNDSNKESECQKIRLPHITFPKSNGKKGVSNRKPMLGQKKKMKERLILLPKNHIISKPSDFHCRIKLESIISLRNSNSPINNKINSNNNNNSNQHTHYFEALSPISTNHNLNTYSERDMNFSPKYPYKKTFHFNSESMRRVINKKELFKLKATPQALKQSKPDDHLIEGSKGNTLLNYTKKYSSMRDIKPIKPSDSETKIVIKKRKEMNWNFFSKEALRNNVNNTKLVRISKYESPMKIIQNESLIKTILMNNLANMGQVQF